jgi:hypothetical protein
MFLNHNELQRYYRKLRNLSGLRVLTPEQVNMIEQMRALRFSLEYIANKLILKHEHRWS